MNSKEKRELAVSEIALVVLAVIGLAVVAWLAWFRPAHKAPISSYADCVSGGNPVQQTYPEICVSGSKRFVNPEQKNATPPPKKQQYLAISQWGVSVPLTDQTADLTYTYDKNDTYEGVFFGFKRLQDANICKSGVGVALTRTATENQPPYTVDNPSVFKKIGSYYYYRSYGGSDCFDASSAAQMQVVQQINDGNLRDAVSGVLQNLQVTPQD
ncbi:MAG TPA: hypothetical protein VLI54_04600 [Bacillota bacterium]|nr:hypothetical protein [Bacillota bacterium]